ncbi:MAG: GGDEF domain-containing protein [Desulfuromonas sp.]|nr:GGDEF domain-containing protein [Desulfuromonas sp.]
MVSADREIELLHELKQLRRENQRLRLLNKKIIQERDETTRTFRELFDKTPHIAVQGYSPERKLIYWNRYSEELYGYSRDEVLGRSWEDLFIPEEMQSAAINRIEHWLAQGGGTMPAIEVVRRHKDGSEVPVYSQYVVTRTLSGGAEIYCLDIDLQELKRSEALLEKTLILSVTDPLTGLYNRGYYNQQILPEMHRARRDGKYLVYAMLDLDHFKKYNDTYGHLKGDELLRKISSIFQQQLSRAGDYVFRMGGEEFLVLYSTSDESSAVVLLENLLVAIEDLDIPHANNLPYGHVTSSAGVYLYHPEDNLSPDVLYARADKALYAAKEAGRNCVVVYQST